MGCHCGAPAAVGTGVLRALVAADRTGEPVRGPRAVEAGKAEIPEGGEVKETVRKLISAMLCVQSPDKHAQRGCGELLAGLQPQFQKS